MITRKSRLPTVWLPIALLLISAVLRFGGLATQGLWDDEGISYGRVILPWSQMIRSLPAEQMPLYYIGLKAWIGLMGRSIFAMRAFSALPGVVLVALTFCLGRRWFGFWGGTVAALLLAVAPASIYQAQTMRGYPWLALFTVGAVAMAERALDRGSLGARTGYVLLASAAMLTHLLAAPALLMLNVWVLCTRWRERSTLVHWLPLQAAVLVPSLLWMFSAGASRVETLSTAGGNIPSLWQLGRDFASVLAVAPYDPPTWAQALTGLPIFVLALIGWGSCTRIPRQQQGRKWSVTHLVSLLWLIPPLFLYLLALVGDVPLYPYYWVALAPWIYLSASEGLRRVAAWRQWSGLGLVLLLLGVSGWQLDRYYRRTVEDLYPLAEQIESQASPGDAIVLSSIWRAECFKYYDQSGLALFAEPTEDEVRHIVAQHQRIWLVVFGHHPTPPIVQGIIGPGFSVGRWTSGTTEMGLYLDSALPSEIRHPLDVSFGQQIELLGYDLQPGSVEAGAVAQLTLWWRAAKPPNIPYKVFIHIVGLDGQIWGQQDSEPVDGTRPTQTWSPGEVLVDRHAVSITPGTLPGEYRLILGLYDASTGQRLGVEGVQVQSQDSALVLQTVGVVEGPQPDVGRLEIQHRLDLSLPDGLTLVGYDMHKLGRERSNVRFKRGDFIHLVLYWLTSQATMGQYTVTWELVDHQGRVMSQLEGSAENLAAPGPAWPQGTLVTRQHDLGIPANVALGDYDLFFTLRDSAGSLVVPRRQVGPITVFPNITPTPHP